MVNRLLTALWVLCWLSASHAVAGAPVNLARSARVSASSQHSPPYAPRWAVDGVIPELLCKDDVGRAWAVDGAKAGHRATFVLEWDEPVDVAEIIYYGRTAWLVEECWREYEVYLDEAAEPVARGQFEMNAGPQRVPVPRTKAKRIRLEFLSSYGGMNCGAAEIEVYSVSPPDDALPRLKRMPTNHAARARISATSEYSNDYRASLATDGRIPEPLSLSDNGRAWAVRGEQAGGKADFILEWDTPVRVASVVYFARTAMMLEEGFRDYELWVGDDQQPALKGAFLRGGGPQVLILDPVRTARRLKLRFLSSYGGPNPGAEEIQVLDTAPDLERLPPFLPDGWRKPEESPELTQLVADGGLGFDRMLVIRRFELNPSHVYTVHCEGFRPGGGLYVLSPPTPEGKLTEILASPEGQLLDYDLSFDAREIVFSWRRTPQDSYHVYRMNVDGTGLTQLTDGPWHDYNARWLPDGDIIYVSTRDGQFAMCFVTPSGVLYRMTRDGESQRRLSANYIDDFTPAVMPDGRILYTRWEYVDRPAIPIQSLWTMNPDGSGVQSYYGNRVLSPATLIEARPVPGEDSVICTLTAHNGPIRGGTGIIERRLGINAQSALRNLTPDVHIGRVDQGSGNDVVGPYENPYPLEGGRFLVSGKGNVYLADTENRWAVVHPAPRDGGPGFFNPQPLRPRPVPPVVPSSLSPELVDQAAVLLLDVHRGLAPQVERGEVRQIAVIQEMAKPLRTHVLGFGFQRPVISCGATYAAKKVWGYVPVAKDGSAFFTVPTGVPLYFEALDEKGRAVQRMRSFANFMPGETRSCVGCHEPRETTPATQRAISSGRDPRALEPPEWGVTNFDYPTLVQPVLDRHCTRCHSGVRPAGRVDLSGGKTDWFSVSYEVLSRRYVSWIDTRNGNEANILQIEPKRWGSPASRLADLVVSGHPDAEGKPRVALSDSERRRILTWIDLNIPYYGTYEMAYPDAEGGRRIVPEDLNEKLNSVTARRCMRCHQTGVPSEGFVRLTEPQLNDFLAAPLAKSAGGRGSCGETVFRSVEDADYQALLKCFEPVNQMLAQRPRMDMPGASPAPANRSCQ